LRYFTDFGKPAFQHITAPICGGIYPRVYCILYVKLTARKPKKIDPIFARWSQQLTTWHREYDRSRTCRCYWKHSHPSSTRAYFCLRVLFTTAKC